jgi:hypothetical protein
MSYAQRAGVSVGAFVGLGLGLAYDDTLWLLKAVLCFPVAWFAIIDTRVELS